MNGFSSGERLLADGPLVLLHGLEHRTLHLRRRTVDLVCQHDIGEDGASFLTVNSPLCWSYISVPTRSAGRRSGGELEALEAGVDDPGQRADGQRLGKAGHAFEQDVSVTEQADEQPFDHVTLSDDDLAHFGQDLLDELTFLLDEIVYPINVVVGRHG